MELATVAILFTDLVDSTALSARMSAAEADELRRTHFALLREQVTATGGTEVKNLGDGLMVAFDGASKALACATAIQRSAARTNHRAHVDLSIRIGIAFGEATVDGGDYFGDVVVQAARLCAAAQGGQILATELLCAVVGRNTTEELVPIGPMPLKGLPERVQTVEVRWDSTIEDCDPSTELALFGRVAEFAQLNEVLKATMGGRCMTAWIGGEAGIGKSRLLAEAAAEAEKHAFVVFSGAAFELERGRPFGSLVDALGIRPGVADQSRRTIYTLMTSSSASIEPPPSGVDAGYQIIDAFLRFLEETASKAPVLLALEDVHWADPSTIRALHAITRRLGDLPIAVLATLRPLPRPPDLERLIATTPRATWIGLEPLEAAAIAQLTEQMIGATPGNSLMDQVSEAGGNPLFVIELLRALHDEKSIDFSSGLAETHSMSPPPSLRLTILGRINFLTDESLDLLRLASILGSTFSLTDLATVTGRATTDLVGPIREAVRAGIVADAAGRLMFRHDLIRAAIYEDLPLGVRTALHRDASRALAAAGAPLLQVAEHAALGAQRGDVDAVRRLREAASSLIIIAPPVAVRLLERALELVPPADRLYQEVASDLVMPLNLLGRIGEANALAREVLAGEVHPDIEYVVRRSLAYQLTLGATDTTAAVEEYRRVVAMSGAPARESREANHSIDVTNLALSLMTLGDVDSARSYGEEALELAEKAESQSARTLALGALSCISGAQGRAAEAMDLAGRAMRIAQPDPALGNYWTHWALGVAYAGADRPHDADSVLRTGLRLVEDQGRVAQFAHYHLALQLVLLDAGRWDDALVEFEAALSSTVEGGGGLVLTFGRSMTAFIAIHRGQLDLAEHTVAQAETSAARTGLRYGLDFHAFTKALLLQANGHADEALALQCAAWDALPSVRYSNGHWRSIAPFLVRLALQLGDRARAHRVTEDAEEGSRRSGGIGSAQGTAWWCRGLLDGNAQLLLDAGESLRQAGRPIDRALACEDAGTLLASSDQIDEAARLFHDAQDVFERVGAAHDSSRLAATLRRFGIRRGVRRARGRPATGWESLTSTELHAVRLVAVGLSNAQIANQMFISRYTVETHLKHVYAKLGIGSRTELAAQAARREAESSGS